MDQQPAYYCPICNTRLDARTVVGPNLDSSITPSHTDHGFDCPGRVARRDRQHRRGDRDRGAVVITVTVTPAQHAALALHSLAVAHDPAIDDDEDDAVIAAALVGRRLRYDPADADRLWSALNDLANRIDSAIIDGHSSDRRADRAAERSIARLARAVLAGSR